MIEPDKTQGFRLFPDPWHPVNHARAFLNRDPGIKAVACGGLLHHRGKVGRHIVFRCGDCGDVLLVDAATGRVAWAEPLTARPSYFAIEGAQARKGVLDTLALLSTVLEHGELDPVSADALDRAHETLARVVHGKEPI